MKKFLENIYFPMEHGASLVGWVLPKHVADMSKIAVPEKLNKNFEKELDAAIEANRGERTLPLIFIFGEWGSGKTFQLLSYWNSKKQNPKDNPKIKYVSMWGTHNVAGGLFKTMSFLERYSVVILLFLFSVVIMLFLFALVCFTWDISLFLLLCDVFLKQPLTGAIYAVLLTLFVSDKIKFIYTLVSFVLNFMKIINPAPKIIVLDDLERSSLSKQEQQQLLISLWTYKIQYIVPVGYVDEDSKLQMQDLAAKLNGKIIELPASNEAKFQVLNTAIPGLFETGKGWIDYITFRDVTLIISQWKELKLEIQNIRHSQLLAFKLIWDRLLDRFGVSMEMRQDLSGGLFNMITFGGNSFLFDDKGLFPGYKLRHLNEILTAYIKDVKISNSATFLEVLGVNVIARSTCVDSPQDFIRLINNLSVSKG